MRRSLLLLAVAVSACGAPRPVVGPPGTAVTDEGLSLTTPASSYLRGQPVPLQLRNDGDDTFEGGVLGCAALEKWTRDGWVPAEEADPRACVMMLVTLEPGRTLEAEIPLDVEPGSYRFVHTMTESGGDDRATVATQAFQIGARHAR